MSNGLFILLFCFFEKIDGINPGTEAALELYVIEFGNPHIEAITLSTIENSGDKPAAQVVARVPPNLFDFDQCQN